MSAPVSTSRLQALAHAPLPVPPELARQGPMQEGAFTSPLHNRYNAAWLGYALGWTFLVCFVTGLISHWAQNPPGWFVLPTRPVWIYRATQGTHTVAGIACIPLLLAKLWVVYPRFWEWPPVRSLAHGLERLSLLGLVGGSVFQLVTGLANIYQWYFFRFFFTPVHYLTSYVVIGSLLIHIGTKIALARDALRHPERYDAPRSERPKSTALSWNALPEPAPNLPRPVSNDPTPNQYDDRHRAVHALSSPSWFGETPAPVLPVQPGVQPQRAPDVTVKPVAPVVYEYLELPPGLSRRWFLGTVGAAAGAVTVATIGQTVTPVRSLSVLAPRVSGGGAERVPINKTAAAAGVRTVAADAAYVLRVTGRTGRPVLLTLDELEALPRHQADLPLTCVEGWSVGARWTGVRVRDLVRMAGGSLDGRVRVESLERSGLYRSSVLEPSFVRAGNTLLATHLDGERLSLDHGYPLRLIAANRPGVQQTKWVTEVVLL